MSLVKNAPNAAKGKQVLDYRAVRQGPGAVDERVPASRRGRSSCRRPSGSKFLPDSEYARAKPIDYEKMELAQKGFSERYLAEVH